MELCIKTIQEGKYSFIRLASSVIEAKVLDNISPRTEAHIQAEAEPPNNKQRVTHISGKEFCAATEQTGIFHFHSQSPRTTTQHLMYFQAYFSHLLFNMQRPLSRFTQEARH